MTMKIGLTDAISALVPDAAFRLVNNDLSTLEFFKPKDATVPTQAQIDAKIAELQSAQEQKDLQAEAAKAAAQAKLAALGLTTDDLKALGL